MTYVVACEVFLSFVLADAAAAEVLDDSVSRHLPHVSSSHSEHVDLAMK